MRAIVRRAQTDDGDLLVKRWIKAVEENQGKLGQLLKALEGARSVLIGTHNNPDPDAMASAFGMRHLLMNIGKMRPVIGFGGIVGRAENQVMMKLLRINMVQYGKIRNRKFDRLILCDFQPRGKQWTEYGNRKPDVILDHHPSYRRKLAARLADIRTEYGATSTIVTEYLQEAQVPLNARVATALFYGIKTDISDIARKKNEADLCAMRFLFSKISMRWLYRIENPRVPSDYFWAMSRAVAKARVHRDVVVSCLDELPQADYAAVLADYLLKLEGMRWSFSIGCAGDEIVFSIRTLSRMKEAGRVASRLARGRGGSGGGHKMSAAGRIDVSGVPPEKRDHLCEHLTQRFLSLLGRDAGPGKQIGGISAPKQESNELLAGHKKNPEEV